MIGFVIWADVVMRDLRLAGFDVERLDGFPYVRHGCIWNGLLEVDPSAASERFLYDGGTLYVPAGMGHLRKGTPV